MTGAEPPPRIVVTAATGYTGGLVARELAGSGVPFLLTARRADALERRARSLADTAGPPDVPPTRVVDVTDSESLRACLRPGDVVINCAGPFTKLGEPVVRACVEQRAHYLDTTGEQIFMKEIEDRYADAARDAGVAVVNGMAFEYALGDAAAALAARGPERPLSRLDVTYGWRGGAAATTPGTRASMMRFAVRGGWGREGGEWRREPVARRRCRVRLPGGARLPAMSFPTGEIVTVPRHVEVDTVRGWLVAGRAVTWIARVLSPLGLGSSRLLEPLLDRVARLGPDGPDEEERSRGRFDIVASAVGRDGGRRAVAVRGRDPYGVTASVIVRGARALLEREDPGDGFDGSARGPDAGDAEPPGGSAPRGAERTAAPGEPDRTAPDARPSGVLAPSQVVEPAALLDGLGGSGLEWEEAPGAGPEI